MVTVWQLAKGWDTKQRDPLARFVSRADGLGMPKTKTGSAMTAVWKQLHARERAVLVTIAERLLVGQNTYGRLTIGKKKWLKETKEEAMDGLVYIAASLEDEKEE